MRMSLSYHFYRTAMRLLLPPAFLISRIYYSIVRVLFWVVHLFTTRTTVLPPDNDLLQISAEQAANMIRTRDITSLSLVNAYIRRIEEVNDTINAVVIKNFEDAIRKAKLVDQEIESLEDNEEALKELAEKRPLLGIPFTIKDCIEVQGLKCTYGMHHRRDTVAEKNSVVVERLLASGAICLAVTNVPEVCMWWESVNVIYGRTSNPYDNRRIAGGSSGGEAALVAAAGSLIGVGSDIGGSIRMPAFFNGVFGLKPTPGVIPLDGHLPSFKECYRREMLRIGPICRYASDLGLMYKVMGGDRVADLRLDEPVQMNKLRVFYMEGLHTPLCEETNNEMLRAMKRAVRYFELKYDLSAVRVDFPLAHRVTEFFVTSMHAPEEPKLSEILNNFEGKLNCYSEMGKFLIGQSNHTFMALLVGILDDLDPYPEEIKKNLLYKRDRLIREVKDLLGNDGVLLFPSFPSVAPFHNEPLFFPLNFGYTGLFNALAFPVVQCPMGLNGDGMPMGVQIVGAPKSDRLLIAIAKDLEEGFGGWNVPGKRE